MRVYLTEIPDKAPDDGWLLVHNSVRPARRLGARGFRVWVQTANSGPLERCDCGWLADLGQHYRAAKPA